MAATHGAGRAGKASMRHSMWVLGRASLHAEPGAHRRRHASPLYVLPPSHFAARGARPHPSLRRGIDPGRLSRPSLDCQEPTGGMKWDEIDVTGTSACRATRTRDAQHVVCAPGAAAS